MFLRLLYQSFHRQQRRKLLAAVAITLGVTLATAMIVVGVNVGDKISGELRSFGANIVLSPKDDSLAVNVGGVDLRPAMQTAFLKESELPRMKGIFWGHNIKAYSPMLNTTVGVEGKAVQLMGTYFAREAKFGNQSFTTGVKETHRWWQVQGRWPQEDAPEILLGAKLAQEVNKQVGDDLQIADKRLRIVGLLQTGGPEEYEIIAPLHLVQGVMGAPDAVQQVYISALTKPEDAFARRDPEKMSAQDRDRWYCSPYANSIAFQLNEVFPSAHAEQIRQIAQSEGAVLSRISGLMLLVAIAALIAAALAVFSAMAATILERRNEVGLMKSLGAGSNTIGALFLAEAALLGLVSGAVGFLLGVMLARSIGLAVFNSPMTAQPVLVPIVLGLALIVTLVGSFIPIRRAMRLEPMLILRGGA
jgi:putative ABC transport system permease protein